jgi:hypothetical protein
MTSGMAAARTATSVRLATLFGHLSVYPEIHAAGGRDRIGLVSQEVVRTNLLHSKIIKQYHAVRFVDALDRQNRYC